LNGDHNGNGGGSNGGGQDSSERIDEDGGPEESTVVITPDEFLIGALDRLSRGLRGAADRGDGLRAMVEEAASEPRVLILCIREFVDDMTELEMLAGGARRGGVRLEAFLRAKLGLQP
jgi:hypothetical protein